MKIRSITFFLDFSDRELIVRSIHGAFLVHQHEEANLPNPKTGGIISAF